MSPYPPIDDPLRVIEAWRDEAKALGDPEPDAMTLATSTPDGQPSARVVLFRGFSGPRIRFFTNYESAKGAQLAANGRVALCFWWSLLRRQIRVEGTVEKLEPAESDAYFAARPRGHRLGAWASPQSRPIQSVDEIETRHAALEREYEGREVPRPAHWGGYGVTPARIELWVMGDDRLHTRRVFEPSAGGWREHRLAP